MLEFFQTSSLQQVLLIDEKDCCGKSYLCFDAVINIQYGLRVVKYSLNWDSKKICHILGKNSRRAIIIVASIRSVTLLSMKSDLTILKKCPDREFQSRSCSKYHFSGILEIGEILGQFLYYLIAHFRYFVIIEMPCKAMSIFYKIKAFLILQRFHNI